MRTVSVLLLAIVLASAAPAWAGTREGNDPPAAKSSATKAAAPAAKADSATAALPDRAAIASELTRMQQMIQQQSRELAAQRKQIEALERRMGAAGHAAAPATASLAVPAKNAAVARIETSTAATTGPASLAAPRAVPARTAVIREPASKAASLEQGPKLPSAIELAGGRIRLGFTVYGDWGWYANTSYGPQFFTQINQPGPGNNNFNAFDINRSYINFFYTPRSGAYTLRVTPNIYRNTGSFAAQSFGSNAQVGADGQGSLNFRLKYAYVQFNHPFASSSTFGKDKITLGQTTNPLVDWQEAFYGYRFTSLTPWNYLSLSSTHMGAKIGGPVMSHGKMYLDYAVGVFDSGSFHNQEEAAEKQVMTRVSVYPFGGKPRFEGLGFSAFLDFGYENKAPDQQNASLYRTAFFAHYATPHFALLGEYDYGKNAFSAGNLFSGSAPLASDPTYGQLASEASSILTSSAQQRGFDFFGHADIPHTPFSLFGLYQYFQPNINVSSDPLDFERVVGGIGYKYDSHLMFAIDSQNLLYTHSQGTYHGVADAVPPDMNALFINMQVNY